MKRRNGFRAEQWHRLTRIIGGTALNSEVYVQRIGLIALLASMIGLCACDGIGDFGRVQEDFHYSYAMQPGGHLDIENRNGSISIVGWDRDSIDVAGTKYAPEDAELKQLQIKVDVSGNMASIVTETPNGSWGNYGANYTIHLPRTTLVSRAKSTNGSVTAEDMSGGGSLLSTNGRIQLRRDEGNFDIRTTNGSVEFEDCSGVERAETTNGNVDGVLKTGAFDAHTTNGSIDVTISKPLANETLRAKTTNGSIKLELDNFASNPIRVETTHGPVTLRLPHDTDARIDARTNLAEVRSDLPVSAEQSEKHELRGQLGKGGPVISATTTTGSIRIEDANH